MSEELHGKPLTPAETNVAGLLVKGLSNKLIGSELGISPHTAKFHVEQIACKLGAENRTQAAVMIAMRECSCDQSGKERHGTSTSIVKG